MNRLAVGVLETLSGSGLVPLAALAEHFHVSRARVAETLEQIEAAGIRLQRADDAVELDEVAQPEDRRPRGWRPELCDAPGCPARPDLRMVGGCLANPAIRAGTAIAGIGPIQPDPRGVGFLAKRMARRVSAPRQDFAALDRVASDLAKLGVFPASEMQGRAG